jgi:hypothetical protein
VFGYSDSIKKCKVMEDPMKRVARIINDTKELTDKELSKITSAMGDTVRSQSLIVSNIIQANLKAEFVACRKNTPALIKKKKTIAA